MEKQKTIDNITPENYKSLLPEIANLLNLSVSAVERYPTDIQMALCNTYVNNYKSDEIVIKQALGQIVQLNGKTETEIKRYSVNSSKNKNAEQQKESVSDELFAEEIKQLQKTDHENHQKAYENEKKTETEKHIQNSKKKYSTKGFLSREQIIKNAKIISEKYNGQYKQSTEIENEQVLKKQNGQN